MNQLGNGLLSADHHEEALSVQEAELAMMRRLGASEQNILAVQSNLASTYVYLGRPEQALQMDRDIYSGRVKLNGNYHEETIRAAYNCARSLVGLQRFEEAKSLMRKRIPVAQRVLGESHDTLLRMRWNYARTLSWTTAARALDDLREAVTTLEELAPAARRVFGTAHPLTTGIEKDLRFTRAKLRARETPPAKQD